MVFLNCRILKICNLCVLSAFSPENGDDSSLSDNIVYDIAEDINTHTLWVGTRSGLSILKLDEPDAFINYKSGKTDYRIPSDEVNSIMRDAQRNMWIGAIGGRSSDG